MRQPQWCNLSDRWWLADSERRHAHAVLRSAFGQHRVRFPKLRQRSAPAPLDPEVGRMSRGIALRATPPLESEALVPCELILPLRTLRRIRAAAGPLPQVTPGG